MKIFSILLLMNLIYARAIELPRGVDFKMSTFYVPGSQFHCIDKSAEIKWQFVNDDYCDCRDGSDEPGTSACANGHFTCKNIGYKSTIVPSSRVNDGICDCCDGSDEYSGIANCTDTCRNLAADILAKVNAEKAQLEEGHKLYWKFVSDKTSRAVAELKAEYENAVKSKIDYRERKKHQRELQEIREKEELERKEQEKSNEETVKVTEDKDDKSQLEKDTTSNAVESSVDENTNAETGIEEHQTESSDELKKLSEEHNIPMEDLEDSEHNQPINEEGTTERSNDEQPDDITPKKSHENVPHVDPHVPPKGRPDYGPNQVFSILVEKTELGDGECLHFDEGEYTYRLCPFESAYQAHKGSKTGGTLLGTWHGWLGQGHGEANSAVITDTSHLEGISPSLKDDGIVIDERIPSDAELKNQLETEDARRVGRVYNKMFYSDGAQCWNGPSRSVKVNINCGSQNQIVAVSEPSRCEYEFQMTTPAACNLSVDQYLAEKYPELVNNGILPVSNN